MWETEGKTLFLLLARFILKARAAAITIRRFSSPVSKIMREKLNVGTQFAAERIYFLGT